MQVDSSVPLTELFAAMPWGDLWNDADMVSVVRYLRGSKKLRIPPEWREVLLKGLV